MDSRVAVGRSAGERNWLWTEIVEDTISSYSKYSEKAFIEDGVPHVITVKVEEPVIGEEDSLYAIHDMNHCCSCSSMSAIACLEMYGVLVWHVGWSFYLFSTIGGLIGARSGGKESCVLKIGRRTTRVWKGRGASASRGLSEVKRGGQRRGWQGTGMTGSS